LNYVVFNVSAELIFSSSHSIILYVLVIILWNRREIQDLYECLDENILKNLPEKDVVSRKDFHRICGIVDVNSLDVGHDATVGNLSALYASFAMLEHCCLPNIKLTVNKFQVVARASKSISKWVLKLKFLHSTS
jgi:hypothetical protein